MWAQVRELTGTVEKADPPYAHRGCSKPPTGVGADRPGPGGAVSPECPAAD